MEAANLFWNLRAKGYSVELASAAAEALVKAQVVARKAAALAAGAWVLGLAGSVGAQSLPVINITPNQGAAEDVTETTIEISTTDDHSSTVESTVDNSVSEEHSTEIDNSIDEQTNNVRVGEGLKHRASGAAESRSASIPLDHPCGDSTGLSAQTGIAGGSLSTVSEACRAFRVEEYGRRSTNRARKFAVETAYWLGFPTRLALAIATGGALN
jgi:hypothetical protein